MSELNFGEVLSVVNDAPIIYSVWGVEVDQTSYYSLGEFLLAYKFAPSRVANEELEKTHICKISQMVMDLELSLVPQDLHNVFVACSLVAIKKNPHIEYHNILMADFVEFTRGTKPLSGQQLKMEILNFYFQINSQWPRQRVGLPDLQDNFNAPIEELRDWQLSLVEEEFLVQERGFEQFRINRGSVKMQTFRINPRKISAVATILKDFRYRRQTNGLLIFLSYSTRDKMLAGQVKHSLEESYGFRVFLAHEDIEPSDEWVDEIIRNLNECDVFIPLINDNFKASLWTDQEAGQAFALKKYILPLKFGRDPYGFLSRYQGQPITPESVDQVCMKIANKIRTHLGITSKST